MDSLNYPGGVTQCERLDTARQLSPLDQLKTTKARKEQEIKELNEAISALEKVPELDKVLHLLGKTLRF